MSEREKLLWQFGEESKSDPNDILRWIDAVWLSGTARDGAGAEMMLSVSSAKDKSARVAPKVLLCCLEDCFFFARLFGCFCGSRICPWDPQTSAKMKANSTKSFESTRL